jgi:ABC-type polysaccharide/polyol phosphate transport system ATPase subunit
MSGKRSHDRGAWPVVIEVRGIEKTFKIPELRVDTLKERATHPFRRIACRELRALRQVTFDVHRGEFFGIVGRNGSGKSSLLKILASIYRADSGRVRVAGRLAPFIELGVGFNPELTARENVVLNGVLLGLTMRQARARRDAVLEFAELKDFLDLKLKNYSSGMMVRLAFAVMVQADADIMLVDEVLAVGDAAFAQKCMDVFHQKRRAGTTIVLVTHDMATVQSLCHRAIVLHDGEQRYLGAPEDAALTYYRLNFGANRAGPPASEDGERSQDSVLAVNARVVHAGLRNPDGELVESVEQDAPLEVDVAFAVARALSEPDFLFHIVSADGVVVAAFTCTLEHAVAAGERVRITGRVENRLVAGRYYLDCWIRQDRQRNLHEVQALRLLRFVVYGTAPRFGVVRLETDLEPVVEHEVQE